MTCWSVACWRPATATLRGAIKAVDAGVDGLIVEGAESAGIRNPEEVHTFALLQKARRLGVGQTLDLA